MNRWILIAALVMGVALYLGPRLQIFSMIRGNGGYGAITGTKQAESERGEMFIRAAIDKGTIRRATVADQIAWVRGLEDSEVSPQYQSLQLLPKNLRTDMAFVVLDKIEFPTGVIDDVLTPKTFIVPEGVPVPRGDPGRNTLWITKPHECRGFLC